MAVNFVLVLSALIVGGVFFNMSVIADGLHTLADIGASALIILATVVSRPMADKDHNYGHEKREPLIVLFFALLLIGLSAYLFYTSIAGLITPSAVELNFGVEFWLLVGVTVLSMLAKEGMFWYQIIVSKKYKSELLKANAWHSRTDSISSMGVLAGLVTSSFIGNNLVESIAILITALLILWIAIKILLNSFNSLTDKAVDERIHQLLKAVIEGEEGVLKVDSLQTRQFASAIYVDVEIAVDGALSVVAGHDIAERVHNKLEALDEPNIKHANVHVNPFTRLVQ